MGILQDERVSSSDHRLLVMEYDLVIALNLEDMPQVHSRPKQIDYKNKLQVNNFCDKVMATIPKEQMEREIECLEQISRIPSSEQDGSLNLRIMKWFDYLANLKLAEEAITEISSKYLRQETTVCYGFRNIGYAGELQ